jgi:hypothetical protein
VLVGAAIAVSPLVEANVAAGPGSAAVVRPEAPTVALAGGPVVPIVAASDATDLCEESARQTGQRPTATVGRPQTGHSIDKLLTESHYASEAGEWK